MTPISLPTVSAAEAVKRVSSGNRVYIGSNCGQPPLLSKALGDRHDLERVEIVHLLTVGPAPYCDKPNFWHKGFFIAGNTRPAYRNRTCDYIPIFLSEIGPLMRSRNLPIDVAMVSVTPPDAHGFCSLGVSVDIGLAACESAQMVLAEVNPNMPRTHGDAFLHIDQISAFVNNDSPVPEYGNTPTDDISRAIASHIAPHVEDGATIQTGIGSIPTAVLERLTEKNDLGVHTEMFSDGMVDLVRRGNVTCKRKSYIPGHVVCTFVIGTQALYDEINDNPFYQFRQSEHANDPFLIAQNDNMVAINGAIEVDLTGQVVADSIGHGIYSGIGGQVDFIRGASRSKGGLPIIAMPSLTSKGESKIVTTLKPGAGVVTSRGDVRYVATEYGIVGLHGKSIGERAEALVSIAHPSMRAKLEAEARELGLWRHPRWM